ncbi:hypothetical protein [Pseudorhodoplanes sp.]|uniref:hypothetical protein n=1 Tax=Pseudorhodoplanes sp. TaxID=1934341 RepID=UPI00391D8F7D
MDDKIDAVPAMDCPHCKQRMSVRAYLPRSGALPAVAGYWCEACRQEFTIEID